jgi:hypothetical protein
VPSRRGPNGPIIVSGGRRSKSRLGVATLEGFGVLAGVTFPAGRGMESPGELFFDLKAGGRARPFSISEPARAGRLVVW